MFNALSGPILYTQPELSRPGYYFTFNNRIYGFLNTLAEATGALAKAQQDFFDAEIRPVYEEYQNITSTWQALLVEVRIRIEAAGLPMPDIDNPV